MSLEKKVLVVDDEVHILHVVSLKLRNAGYEVITAQDGKEALELAQVEIPYSEFWIKLRHSFTLSLARRLILEQIGG